LLLYYITDRSQFPGDEATRRGRLLENIAEAVRCGVDYIQLREKDLSTRELEMLAGEVMARVHELRTGNSKPGTGLLINSRTDIALACDADGVHLRSEDISPAEVRRIWTQFGAGTRARVTIGVSCHTPSEVADAAARGADFALFGPIFEKKAAPDTRPVGLDALRQACRQKIPVLALGGITTENAGICIREGVAGIAGIRLFQENKIGKAVRELRSSSHQSSVFGRQPTKPRSTS
jgi:thiamine-phosphate pyrophosphorylase